MVSEEMKDAMEQLKRFQNRLLKRLNYEKVNAEKWRQAENMMARSLPIPEDVKWEQVNADGVVAGFISTPGVSQDRVLFSIHGGSYVAGSIFNNKENLGRWSRQAKMTVFAVEYRLAPEHPFPAGLNDCIKAYIWLIKERKIKSKNVIIFGSSAGGGLTVAMLLKLRDKGEKLPAAAVLQSPWLDLTLSGRSIKSKAEVDPILNEGFLRIAAQWYCGAEDPRNPLISTIFADLTGLPSLFVQVGTSEILLDDSIRLTEKAKTAGIDVQLKIWEGMPHSFIGMSPSIPEVPKGRAQIANFLHDIFKN